MDRDVLRRQVKEMLATGLRLEVPPADITDDGPIFGEGLGLDSIDALELVVLVEERFHLQVPDEEVGQRAFASVNALVEFIVSFLVITGHEKLGNRRAVHQQRARPGVTPDSLLRKFQRAVFGAVIRLQS